MIRVDVEDARARPSEYLEQVEKGETVIVCRSGIPIAEIRPISGRNPAPRPIGKAEGLVEIPDSFFEPLPGEVIRSFGEE